MSCYRQPGISLSWIFHSFHSYLIPKLAKSMSLKLFPSLAATLQNGLSTPWEFLFRRRCIRAEELPRTIGPRIATPPLIVMPGRRGTRSLAFS
jgi:hypothetical protein